MRVLKGDNGMKRGLFLSDEKTGKKRWFAPNCGPLWGLLWKKASANYPSWSDENWAYDRGASKVHLGGQTGLFLFDDFSKVGPGGPVEASSHKHKYSYGVTRVLLDWLWYLQVEWRELEHFLAFLVVSRQSTCKYPWRPISRIAHQGRWIPHHSEFCIIKLYPEITLSFFCRFPKGGKTAPHWHIINPTVTIHEHNNASPFAYNETNVHVVFQDMCTTCKWAFSCKSITITVI